MGTTSKTGIIVCFLGGWALTGVGLLIELGGGSATNSSGVAVIGGLLALTGLLGVGVSWIWAIVSSIQAQRWGWLLGMILVPGVTPLLYGLVWPGPVVTGALGIDKSPSPAATAPPAAPFTPAAAAAPYSPPVGATEQWEYCEIDFYTEGWMENQGYFRADAVGPRGQYAAAQNRGRCKAETYSAGIDVLVTGRRSQPTRSCQPLLNELISALTADGWTLTGETGRNWWNHKFRRLATR